MPLTVPVLDDRDFDQLLADATARIPSFTPEWNNYGLDSDPGITLVQLFAFVADTLLYRVNRYPEAMRLKFLQLLGAPLRPAAAASGIVAISNDRGPVAPLLLEAGVQVGAGKVDFVTTGPVNVLPVQAKVVYKRKVDSSDPDYASLLTQYEAIQLADEAASATGTSTGASASSVQLVFYETADMVLPTAANPQPVLDLASDTMDGAVYVALLAPPGVAVADVATAIAGQTLALGIAPAVTGSVPPLAPLQLSTRTPASTTLVYEMPANPGVDVAEARYIALAPLASPDVLNTLGVVQLPLPALADLGNWTFDDPMSEGTEDFPPRIDDSSIAARIVTWIRVRLPASTSGASTTVSPSARLSWLGVNAMQVKQAVAVVNEFFGTGTGEPDQVFSLANSPVLPGTLRVGVQDTRASLPSVAIWGPVEDLLSAQASDLVYRLDPEAATITFGDGIHGARPAAAKRLIASYQYGGGRQGNVGIGAISSSRDARLQGGFSVANPLATSGGDFGQSVSDAEREIPSLIRHKDRLVTAQDFADVVMQTPGVDINRVDVLPLFQPGPPPQDGVAGVVTLMVLSLTDPVRPLWPTPDRLFLGTICSFLDVRRLVTTEIHVRGPEYVPVYVSVGIAVQAGYFPDLVRQAVTTGLNNFLSSLRGYGPGGAGWPLRKRLLDKDLEAAVTRIEGVEYVDSLLLGDSGANPITSQDFTGLQMPRLDGLSVVEGSAQPLASLVGAVVQPAQPGVSIVPVPVTKSTC